MQAKGDGPVTTWSRAASIVLVWCVVELWLRRSGTITDDWQGWRQADTQAIARHLAFDDFDVLRPRIDWGGDGPGYVEAELPLYAAVVGVLLRVFGDGVWPGQLVSLACVAGASLVVFFELARRFGERPALVALIAALTVQGVVVAGTSIQPDAMALGAFAVGFVAFVRWVEQPDDRHLVVWIVATTVAGLVKPTALQLGLSQGLFVLLRRRELLLRPRLWLGWAVVLAVVGAYLWHARSLYLVYGNTFGLLSGGDSKLPTRERIVELWRWRQLATFIVEWGTGILAVPAAAFLLWRRRLGHEEIALAFGTVAASVLAFRYTSHHFGTHYHLPACVLGAWLVARAVHVAEGAWGARVLAVATAAAVATAGLVTFRTLNMLSALAPEPETAVGAMLEEVASPGTLVVVRARAEEVNDEWHTPNNYQDPRIFYLSRTRGWVLPNDAHGAERLSALAQGGARFYAHVAAIPIDAELAAWLSEHAERVAASEAGAVYQLRGVK